MNTCRSARNQDRLWRELATEHACIRCGQGKLSGTQRYCGACRIALEAARTWSEQREEAEDPHAS